MLLINKNEQYALMLILKLKYMGFLCYLIHTITQHSLHFMISRFCGIFSGVFMATPGVIVGVSGGIEGIGVGEELGVRWRG